MRGVVLGDDEQSRGSLVEAMHDAGTLDAADAGKAVAAMGDERVDERSACVSGARVHDEVRRLVDDDDVAILVDDVEIDGLGGGLRRLRLRHQNAERFARFDPVGPISYGRAVRAADVAGADQRLDAGAAQPFDALGEQLVEADAGVRLRRRSARSAARSLSIDGLCHGLRTGLRMASTTREEGECRRPKR